MSRNTSKEERFYAKSDLGMKIIYWFAFFVSNLTFAIPLFIGKEIESTTLLVLSCLCLLVDFFLLNLWFQTYYWFETHVLHFRTGIIYHGKIDLNKATILYKNRSVFGLNSPIRASFTLRPLILKYNKWDEMSFSPQEEEKFIERLLESNPEIKIIDKKLE